MVSFVKSEKIFRVGSCNVTLIHHFLCSEFHHFRACFDCIVPPQPPTDAMGSGKAAGRWLLVGRGKASHAGIYYSPQLRPDPTEIMRALEALCEPNQVTELRILDASKRRGTISGWYDDPDVLVKHAVKLDGAGPATCITLNPCLPALLSRAENRYVVNAKRTTADNEIVRYRWLPLDFDPVRVAGVSSTNDEHEWALEGARQTRLVLREEQGWPEPIPGDSGNDGRLLYCIGSICPMMRTAKTCCSRC
jgi:hypothetical protein